MSNFYNVSDLLVFGVLAAVVVSMIIIAEVMRATAKYCDPHEASNRLRVSIGLFRTALILLFMYGANQTLETHQLKAVVKNARPVLDGSKMAESQPEWRIETPSGNVVTWTGETNDVRNRVADDDQRGFSPGYFDYRSGAAAGDRRF